MVKPERGENQVPDPEETEKQGKVLDLDPHGEKFSKGDRTGRVVHHPSGQGEGDNHNQHVK